MDVRVDTVKPIFLVTVLSCSVQGTECGLGVVPKKDRRVYLSDTRIQSGELGQGLPRFELSLSAPLHRRIPCVVYRIAFAFGEECADDPRIHRFVHIHLEGSLKASRGIKGWLLHHVEYPLGL